MGGPGFPLFSLPEPRRAPRLCVLLQPPAPHGGLGLPSPAPGLSSPPPASSSFPAQLRCIRRLRRREASEWRTPRSQNTMRSQNAARRTPPLPFPSGESGLASVSSSPRRLGNIGSSTIVPAPEERADDGDQVPPELAFSKHPTTGTGWTEGRRSRAWALGSGAIEPKARISPHNLTFGTRHCQVRAP